MQTRGHPSVGSAHIAFGGGQIRGPPVQAAFGGQTPSNFGMGQQGVQGVNQGNFGMGGNMGGSMGQAMPFQQTGFGISGPSSAQAAFMGGSQIGNQQQIWPMQNQGQPSLPGLQQGGIGGAMLQQVNQVPVQGQAQGQDSATGQQTSGQAQHAQGANMQVPHGFAAAAAFQQFPQQGQGYQM